MWPWVTGGNMAGEGPTLMEQAFQGDGREMISRPIITYSGKCNNETITSRRDREFLRAGLQGACRTPTVSTRGPGRERRK